MKNKRMDTKGYNWGGFLPYKHQRDHVINHGADEHHALLWEMRTGKTPSVIHTIAFLKSQGEISGALIMAPNYLKTEWRDQFQEHAPDWLEYDLHLWYPTAKIEEQVNALRGNGRLNVLIMNEEAFSTKRGAEVAARFLNNHRALFAIDEATAIANPKAKRTKNVMKLRPLADYRRILTGTPITKGPLDLWAPFYFLDPNILGYKTYFGMRAQHAVMGGFKGKEILGYVGVDKLQKRVERVSSRVLRSDVRDMPPKVFNKILIPLDTNPEQKRLYEQMKNEMIAEWEGKRLEAMVILSQLLRLSQITGGFVPHEESDGQAVAIPGVNPKLEALVTAIKQTDEPVVIFSRFRAEIAAISDRLQQEYGEGSVVEYHGGVTQKDKDAGKRRFINGEARFFVANQASARMGLDLSVASLVCYFTNSFALLDRIQTEDRTETVKHDKGSTTYLDLVMEDTLDLKVLESLVGKQKLSDLITGDTRLQEWI